MRNFITSGYRPRVHVTTGCGDRIAQRRTGENGSLMTGCGDGSGPLMTGCGPDVPDVAVQLGGGILQKQIWKLSNDDDVIRGFPQGSVLCRSSLLYVAYLQFLYSQFLYKLNINGVMSLTHVSSIFKARWVHKASMIIIHRHRRAVETATLWKWYSSYRLIS